MLVLIVGVIVVVGILVAAGWWYLSSARLPGPQLQQGIPGGMRTLPPITQMNASPTPEVDSTTEQLSVQGTSDDPAEIAKDVNQTDFSGLDAEASQM